MRVAEFPSLRLYHLQSPPCLRNQSTGGGFSITGEGFTHPERPSGVWGSFMRRRKHSPAGRFLSVRSSRSEVQRP